MFVLKTTLNRQQTVLALWLEQLWLEHTRAASDNDQWLIGKLVW
jgi:hypothetical protein